MLKQYAPYSVARRMQIAVDEVLEKGVSQAEAARKTGVSRSRLNEHVKKANEVFAAQQERSRLAREERNQRDQPVEPVEPVERPLHVTGEVRRVQPFADFARTYFAQLVCPDCGVHHELPDFHVGMMDVLSGPDKRVLINMPPYHSKSTIATVQQTVYDLCKDPNHRTVIVSKSQRLAERFLYSIVKHLTDPAVYHGGPNLIEDWGPFQGPSDWNKSQIYVAGRNSSEKDPSVACLGVSAHIYGVRAEKIIFDDIADLENQRNQERVIEMLTWCTQEAGSRVGKTGKLQFIGTRISAGDIYSHLEKLPAFKTMRFPCILDEETKTTLWPEHFGYENADLQRSSMTSDQWQLVYQNVDTPGFNASFTPEILEGCRDMTSVLGSYDPNWALIAGLDPAGANSQAGYTALVLLGVDMKTGVRHLVDMVNVKQMKAPQLRDQLFDWADRYPLRELRVEVNGLQSQLVQYNQEIITRLTNRGVRVVPHITSGHNKWDPQFGVESMSPMFYNKQILFPGADISTRNRVRSLEEQLISFPMGRTSDLVMALWFAELGAREIFQRAMLPMFDPRVRLPSRVAKNRRVIDFAERTVRPPSAATAMPGREMFPGRQVGEVKMVNVGGSVTLPG